MGCSSRTTFKTECDVAGDTKYEWERVAPSTRQDGTDFIAWTSSNSASRRYSKECHPQKSAVSSPPKSSTTTTETKFGESGSSAARYFTYQFRRLLHAQRATNSALYRSQPHIIESHRWEAAHSTTSEAMLAKELWHPLAQQLSSI